MMRLVNPTLIIFIFLITAISAQNYNYFNKDNSQAIRDSLNRIKYVNPNTAVEFSFEILEKYTEDRPNRVIGSVYAVLAQIYHLKGLPTQTIDYLNDAEQEFESLLGFVPPWFQIDIGNIYFSQGLLSKARSAYLNAYKTFESPAKPFSKQDQLAGMAVSVNNIALVDIELENYASAEEYYFEGLKFRRERGQHDDLAHSYLSLAELYMKWEDKDLALQYCDSTELVVSKFFTDPNETQIGATLNSYNRYYGMSQQYRAEYATKFNRKKEAIEYFRSAENHYEKLPIELSRLMLVRAKAYDQFGDLQNAIRDIESGLKIVENQGLFREKLRLLEQKKVFLITQGDRDGSMIISEQLLSLNQEKMNRQNQDLFINLQLRNDLKSKEQQLSAVLSERKQFITLSIIGFAILGLVIVTFRNQNIASQQQKILAEQSKQMAELELKTTEKELKSATTSIMEKNEMIESIKKDVKYASDFLSNSDSKYLMAPLKSKLEDATSGNTNWDDFQARFNKVYPGFLDELTTLNGSLTISDLRLCAYLKAGQTTKEIAQLTGLSVRSIESRRYRLRKKLNLNRKLSLYKFINQIELYPIEKEPETI